MSEYKRKPFCQKVVLYNVGWLFCLLKAQVKIDKYLSTSCSWDLQAQYVYRYHHEIALNYGIIAEELCVYVCSDFVALIMVISIGENDNVFKKENVQSQVINANIVVVFEISIFFPIFRSLKNSFYFAPILSSSGGG